MGWGVDVYDKREEVGCVCDRAPAIRSISCKKTEMGLMRMNDCFFVNTNTS